MINFVMKNKISILIGAGSIVLLWACIDYDFSSLPSVPQHSVVDSTAVDTLVKDTTTVDSLTSH